MSSIIDTQWNTPYSGEEIDTALDKASELSALASGWTIIKSSATSKVDLNNLRTPGNYTIDYFINGSSHFSMYKPINISVSSIDGVITQSAFLINGVVTRTAKNAKAWNAWELNTDISEVRFGTSYPTYPTKGMLFIDTNTNSMFIYNNKWCEVKPWGTMDPSVYDQNNIKIDLYNYIGVMLETLINTDDFDYKYTYNDVINHMKSVDVHVTASEKSVWNGKLSIKQANELMAEILNNAKKYVDGTNRDSLELLNTINTSQTKLMNDFDKHINPPATVTINLHVTAEEKAVWNAKANNDHTHILDGNVSIDGSQIVSGFISEDRIPDEAVFKVVKVSTDKERFRLTRNDVSLYDAVMVATKPISFYYVIDINNLNNEAGYELYSSNASNNLKWDNVINTPTTLAGYGITDAYTKNQIQSIEDETYENIFNYVANRLNSINSVTVDGVTRSIKDQFQIHEDKIKSLQSDINAVYKYNSSSTTKGVIEGSLAAIQSIFNDLDSLQESVNALLD